MIYAVAFYLVALMAALFAFGSSTIANVLFFVSLGLSLAAGLLAIRRRDQSPP